MPEETPEAGQVVDVPSEDNLRHLVAEVMRLRHESRMMQTFLAACVVSKRNQQITLDRLQLRLGAGKVVIIRADEKEGWIEIRTKDRPPDPQVNGAPEEIKP